MDAASSKLADLDSLSVEQLKALLREQHTKLQEQQTTLQEQHAALEEKHAQLVAQDALLRSYTIEIQSLRLQIFKLRKMQYGTSSEKRALEIKQLELWVQELEEAVSQRSSELAEQVGLPPSIPKKRREFPAHLARETQTIAPLQSSCPDCGGELKHLGEDVSEMLELEPFRFKVIRHVRPNLRAQAAIRSCRRPHRRERSTAAWLDRDSWRICSSANIAITFHFIAKRRSTRAKASS